MKKVEKRNVTDASRLAVHEIFPDLTEEERHAKYSRICSRLYDVFSNGQKE